MLASRGTLRRAGVALRISAIHWLVHCGALLALGVVAFAALWSGGSLDLALVLVLLVAVGAAVSGAIAMGVFLRIQSRGSSDLVHSTSEPMDPTGRDILRTARRDGDFAASLLFGYAGLGFVGISSQFLIPGGLLSFTRAYLAFILWLASSLTLMAAVFLAKGFFERVSPLIGIHGESLPFLSSFAGLTALFAVLAVPFFALSFVVPWVGLVGVFFMIAFPLGLCPLLGIAAFLKVYQLGLRLSQIRPPVGA